MKSNKFWWSNDFTGGGCRTRVPMEILMSESKKKSLTLGQILVHSPGSHILLCCSCVVGTHIFYLIEIIKPTRSTIVVWVRSDGQTA